MNELTDQIIDSIIELLESGQDLPDELLDEIMEFIQEEIQDKERPIEAPIPDNAKLLWELSGGQPQAFASYLREFEDPTLKPLLENPNELASVMERLQQSSPSVDISQSKDGFKKADLNSSNIYGFKFDPKSKKMRVRFQEGAVYEYDNIPDSIFQLFASGNAAAKTNGKNNFGQWWKGKNPSLGASLNQYIKAGKYPYKRLK